MCELFGLTSKKKISIGGHLETFYSHSSAHRNGWGLAILDNETVSVVREPQRAIESPLLTALLGGGIETAKCIAHIRKATIGEEDARNTHPFCRYDDSGRQWILAHNGTIFDSKALAPYQYIQTGTTDSERILLYIVGRMNTLFREVHHTLSREQRIHTVEEAIRIIVPGNKVNLLLYDGDLLYVHKNEAETLYEKSIDGGVMFSTVPLDGEDWAEFPQNRLMVYSDGKLVYTGFQHNHTYIHDEEKMRLLYLAYSGL